MQKFISYSGGVESTTMLVMFGDKATPIFSDTGWEHAALYEWLNAVESKTGIHVERIRRDGETLPEYISRMKYYPSSMARFCTRRFKIEPIDEYLKSRVPCELMIGLNYDERDRTGNHGLIEGVRYSYPLIDLKITREACIEILTNKDLLPKFPSYMKRGGCIGCFWKSKSEFRQMALQSPNEADSVADLEEHIQDERGEWFSVRRGIPSIRGLIESERRQNRFDFGGDDPDEGGLPTSCGVFCHR
tara:strand:- start:8 stop:745 length:738 start_codon:yes stop_codon:yes gene_type:complete